MSDESTCDVCGEEFKNSHGVAMHKAYSHDNPWQDKEKLQKEYVENERTARDIAEEWGCDAGTIGNWLKRHGIETRSVSEYLREERVALGHHDQGYERWMNYTKPDRGKSVFVHRLLAVSEFGFDAVKGMHVHHKNGIEWDNRPDNIGLKTPREHVKHHQERGEVPFGPEAQSRGGYDPRGLFKGIPNEDRYEGMSKELQNQP